MRKLYLKFVNIEIAILISVTLVELTNKIKKKFLSRYKHNFNKYICLITVLFLQKKNIRIQRNITIQLTIVYCLFL